jgi:hypothetical protein
MKTASIDGNIDHAYRLGPYDIDGYFWGRYKNILTSRQRGGGYGFWLWKPYIVERFIREIPEGHILIYCDSGIEWIDSVGHLIRAMGKDDFLFFSNNHNHLDWCKKEVVTAMLGMVAHERKQVQASVMLFRVNKHTRNFCSEWLAWSCIPGFIDDSFTKIKQIPTFREHRNDQSILTNLQIKYDIPLHWWPTQYGHFIRNLYTDKYPQIFYHHRLRDSDWAPLFSEHGENTLTWYHTKRNKGI